MKKATQTNPSSEINCCLYISDQQLYPRKSVTVCRSPLTSVNFEIDELSFEERVNLRDGPTNLSEF